MSRSHQKFRIKQLRTWGLHTLVVYIDLFGAMNVLVKYKKLQAKPDQMLKE